MDYIDFWDSPGWDDDEGSSADTDWSNEQTDLRDALVEACEIGLFQYSAGQVAAARKRSKRREARLNFFWLSIAPILVAIGLAILGKLNVT